MAKRMTISMNIKNNISYLKNRGEKVDEFENELANLSSKLKDNILT
jgi:hypothetical protein